MRPQDLQKIGFSDKEAAVYLASLELGPASIMEIAKKSRVNRATTYVVMDSLIKKGLAASFEKGKKRYFSVESPERLLSFFRLREQELKEQGREFKAIFPALKQIYEMAGEKPKVRFFEGKEGIRAIQEDILKSKIQSMEEFFNIDVAYKTFPPKPGDHRHRLKKKLKNVPVRRIYTSKIGAILPAKEGSIQNRFITPDRFSGLSFAGEFVIYANKIAMTSPAAKDRIGIILESEEIAKTLRAFFNLTWNNIK